MLEKSNVLKIINVQNQIVVDYLQNITTDINYLYSMIKHCEVDSLHVHVHTSKLKEDSNYKKPD